MKPVERARLAAELANEWASRLRLAVEMMAQQPATVSTTGANAAAVAEAGTLLSLDYELSHAPSAPLRVATPGAASAGIARVVLAASGIEETDEALLTETWQEILAQAASGLAQNVGMRLGQSVGCASAKTAPGAALAGCVHAIVLSIAGQAFAPLFIAFPDAFLDAVGPAGDTQSAETGHDMELTGEMPGGHSTIPPALDLLLDVELPVSVSFGRTYLPVREVLKLATGSIIELDRPVNQDVEVVVNNCVIARGEVVVIEGNYGVRIHQIISRSDRMALQHLTSLNPYQPMRITA